jgi:uncharacterized protein (UPF0332 family)
MFHAATAVLLLQGLTGIATHGGLIGAFGKLTAGLDAAAKAHRSALNRAHDLRLSADYAAQVADLGPASSQLRLDAAQFVLFCEGLVGDSSPSSP